MQKQSLTFLKQLIETPSPSGYEMRIHDKIAKYMGRYCGEVRTDVVGNTIGVINPDAKVRVLLAGHCDEIGMMVMYIDGKGFIYVGAVGGVDVGVIRGHRVTIHSKKGPVLGVIGGKPIHLAEASERNKVPKIKDIWIDIGAKNKKDAERAVAIGDYITVDAGFDELRNGLVVGRGFDDRAGAFVVCETLRRLKGRKLNVAVYGVTTVQEEIGLRGATTSSYGIDPHIGIAIDMGFASDAPGIDPKVVGEAVLGKGPVIHRGPNITPKLGKWLESTAKKKRIPFQVQAEPGASGTDAWAIQVTRSGVATALVSVLNRYMHTPVEILSLKDMDNASRLLTEAIIALSGKNDFTPRSR